MPGGSWGGGSAGWGGGHEGWGGSPGSFSSGPNPITGAVAIAENVIRVYFGAAPYYSQLLDPYDASNPALWTVTAVTTTTGIDGNAARACSVISVAVGSEPASIDLTLDRPMTPWPATYSVAQSGLAYGQPPSLSPIAPSGISLPGTYRQIIAANPDALAPSRDFANPQTASDITTASSLLGTYPTDDSGDYAVDSGLISYKKRCLRRLITRKNAFAHLPGYGVGVPTYGKRLQKAGVRAAIASDAEAQIGQEPETNAVSVTALQDDTDPGLVWFIIKAQTKSGQQANFKAGPFSAT